MAVNGEEDVCTEGDSDPKTPQETGRLGDDARREIQARASPEGIVTILFTDDVDSTRIRQRLGDRASQERFRRHNLVVREQIARYGGYEVKTQGDGFMLAFSSAAAALSCAVAIQRAVAEDNQAHPVERVEVRIGLNCGEAIKEDEDFFGGAVVVAARLGSLAKSGQILVSEAVRVLAGLPEGIGYVRQGRRRLKGLAGSYDVWAVQWREGEEEKTGLAALWARPAVRLLAPVVVLAAVGGGVVGGVAMSQSGDGGAATQSVALREETFRWFVPLVPPVLSGGTECQPGFDDMLALMEGPAEGEVTGGLVGRMIQTDTHTTFYAEDNCVSGFTTGKQTVIDDVGNELHLTFAGPFAAAWANSPASALSMDGTSVLTITGGAGIYEGASGTGACTWRVAARTNPQGVEGQLATNGECAYNVVTAGAASDAAERIIVQLAASSEGVAVLGGSSDLPSTLSLVVQYRNARDEPQRGLSLRLPQPDGAQILAWASGEEPPDSPGERTWPLGDLQEGEFRSFEFTLQFLYTERPTIALVVEIDGQGFNRPVRSEPETIEILR